MAILRLLRFPALFTTFPDVLAGYAIVRQGEIVTHELTWLLVASGLLYLAGMVLNDVFDVEQDRRERPSRPIPAGAISRRSAAILGGGLLLGGVAAAALVNVSAVVVALLLATMILAYDAGGKRTLFGPFLMGCCRALNLLLGAVCTGMPFDPTFMVVWVMAGLIGLYVMGITLFARSEAVESPRADMWSGALLMYAALIGWGMASAANSPESASFKVLLILFLIAFHLTRRIRLAMRTGEPQSVQQAVRLMLLTIPMLEALAIVAHGGEEAIPLAIVAALLVLPGQILSRFIPMT